MNPLLPALVSLRKQQKKKKGRPLVGRFSGEAEAMVFKREMEGKENHAKKDRLRPLCHCCYGKKVLLLIVSVSGGGCREESVDVLREL